MLKLLAGDPHSDNLWGQKMNVVYEKMRKAGDEIPEPSQQVLQLMLLALTFPHQCASLDHDAL